MRGQHGYKIIIYYKLVRLYPWGLDSGCLQQLSSAGHAYGEKHKSTRTIRGSIQSM